MSNIPETVAAIALTQADTSVAQEHFDLARVVAGHAKPRIAHFVRLQSLLSDSSGLPDFVCLGIHRRSLENLNSARSASSGFATAENGRKSGLQPQHTSPVWADTTSRVGAIALLALSMI